MSRPSLPLADARQHLRADCANCAGLCCVAPAFAASADFAIDKPAGRACSNLQDDFRCGIHDRLRDRGFPGCTVFDCFGAGQQLTQVTFGGRTWREAPHLAASQFALFPVMRQLHEMLWYLSESLTLPRAAPLHGELGRAAAGVPAGTPPGHGTSTTLPTVLRSASAWSAFGASSSGCTAPTSGSMWPSSNRRVSSSWTMPIRGGSIFR